MNITVQFPRHFVRSTRRNFVIPSEKLRFRIPPIKSHAKCMENTGFRAVKSPPRLLQIQAAATTEALEIKADGDEETIVDLFACPICYKSLVRKGPSGLNLSSISKSVFQCTKCRKAYSSRDVYLDLTVTADSSEYNEYRPVTTEMFRSPLVSFVYERGWRQSFATSGFPGPDEEFKMAQKYFKPVAGGLVVDVSCGSGLFSRRLVKCEVYSGVVALDFSENMLRQCYEFIKGDKDLYTANLALVRADISRLPFMTSSIDAVHAAAAIHCWPSPSTGIIMDNAIAYVAMGRMIEEIFPTIVRTPCVAHCLDLLLEDIGNIGWMRDVVEKAKSTIKYIYGHTWILNLMRTNFTDEKDLIRVGVTHFATSFLSLQSVVTAQAKLQQMFESKK